MRKAVKLRTLTTEEETEIRKLTASRKAAYRLVQRAKVIVATLDDPKLHATRAGHLASRLIAFDFPDEIATRLDNLL